MNWRRLTERDDAYETGSRIQRYFLYYKYYYYNLLFILFIMFSKRSSALVNSYVLSTCPFETIRLSDRPWFSARRVTLCGVWRDARAHKRKIGLFTLRGRVENLTNGVRTRLDTGNATRAADASHGKRRRRHVPDLRESISTGYGIIRSSPRLMTSKNNIRTRVVRETTRLRADSQT